MPVARWRSYRHFADWRLGLKTPDDSADFDGGGFSG